MTTPHRRLPIGAEVQAEGGVHFRVWAPARRTCEVVLEGSRAPVPLERSPDGYFAGVVAQAGDGARYRFRLDGGELLVPDPASRYQPDGPHGPSQVVDPARFEWTDGAWRGVGRKGHVVYELHVGTFTPEGTYASTLRALPHLEELGVTTVELMPLADFPGRRGWGYDGVNLFAPSQIYGTPDDLRRLVDRAHGLGLAVILDVVYNHLGPDGNYLTQFTPQYFTKKHKGEWGDPLNFDDEGSAGVRELFAANAQHWIDEYHLDGLRLDATQAIHDDSEEHVLAEIVRHARAAARGRGIWIVAENESQEARFLAPPVELDAMWNDDFHHAARVAATGRREAYYSNTHGRPQELVSALKHGFLFQGQHYAWQKKRRGEPSLGVDPERLVVYLQNHDQVANSLRGERLDRQTSPGRLRALTALTLLAPATPLLFQGQEWAASARFLFFVDHNPELNQAVKKGRAEFIAQFPSAASPEARAALDDPAAEATFAVSRLDWREREREPHRGMLALHRDLLRLRREDATIAAGRGLDGAVLGSEAFCLRWLQGEPRLLVVNLGVELWLEQAPEPLLAPPAGCRWRVLWSSEHPSYGGDGTFAPDDDERGWRLPGHAAVLLAPEVAS